ncbi:helix-turn-helix domain-containing protein [Pseudomonas aeruginosa]
MWHSLHGQPNGCTRRGLGHCLPSMQVRPIVADCPTSTLIGFSLFKTSYDYLTYEVGLMSTEPWVNVEQVAQHLDVAKDTVYRWREHRGLPAHRIGRLWKFKLSEVDDWVRAGGADEEHKQD